MRSSINGWPPTEANQFCPSEKTDQSESCPNQSNMSTTLGTTIFISKPVHKRSARRTVDLRNAGGVGLLRLVESLSWLRANTNVLTVCRKGGLGAQPQKQICQQIFCTSAETKEEGATNFTQTLAMDVVFKTSLSSVDVAFLPTVMGSS